MPLTTPPGRGRLPASTQVRGRWCRGHMALLPEPQPRWRSSCRLRVPASAAAVQSPFKSAPCCPHSQDLASLLPPALSPAAALRAPWLPLPWSSSLGHRWGTASWRPSRAKPETRLVARGAYLPARPALLGHKVLCPLRRLFTFKWIPAFCNGGGPAGAEYREQPREPCPLPAAPAIAHVPPFSSIPTPFHLLKS